jgi:hypothetical protein
LSIIGCRPKAPLIELGGYTFSYEGKEYRIESVTPNYSEGYNTLTARENDKIIFKAIDKEQDGLLNEIVSGDLSLKKANEIYQEGILEGERRGYIRKRTFAREYRTSDTINNYVIATYILAIGDVYNKFRIVSRQKFQQDSVLLDENADGELDYIEQGTESMKSYQDLYKEILRKGIKDNKIRKQNDKYIVVL